MDSDGDTRFTAEDTFQPANNRVKWMADVSLRLGYSGRIPHELYRKIESLWLMEKTVLEAVESIKGSKAEPLL